MKLKKNFRLTSAQIILAGFFLVILAGALLLMLPIASMEGTATPFLDCLFTSTSATCVTGLVVYDTATHWSLFGKIVILSLIQVGGLGVITTAFLIRVILGSKISLIQRTLLQDSISGDNVQGIVRMSLYIMKVVMAVELGGAFLMYPVFARDFGPATGAGYALFHSVSAFCNAGFDLMGVRQKYSSLTAYQGSPVINLVIMTLIVFGGLGFYTWRDLQRNKFHFSRYTLQTKVVVTTTAILIFVPAVIFFFAEYGSLPAGERVLSSLFQSVTTRTAGFNTSDLTKFKENDLLIMIMLMLIGGSPGSTAGGMKTTTIAVVVGTFLSMSGRRSSTVLHQRRIPAKTVRAAFSIVLMYVTLFLAGGMAISAMEHRSLLRSFFETSSAIGTVGLTLGLTPSLHMLSKLILIVLMFYGRVGGLTFMYATFRRSRVGSSCLPQEDLNVG